MKSHARVRRTILCVDDDARLLAGLAVALGREYDVHTAAAADASLQLLAELPAWS